MDVAVAGDSQQFEELALAAAKEKAGFVRKRIGGEKARFNLIVLELTRKILWQLDGACTATAQGPPMGSRRR